MAEQSIKEVVKEKYGQAALRAKSGGSSCCERHPHHHRHRHHPHHRLAAAIPSPQIFMTLCRRKESRVKHCWLRWGAGIPRRWRN